MPASLNPTASVESTRMARQIDRGAGRVLILVNRKAGAGRRRVVVDHVVECLASTGIATTVLSDLAELADAAHAAAEAGELRAVVSAGGDGTVTAALNAAPPGTPLAVLPMGTENLLARYLRHRSMPESILSLMTEGVVVPLDAARAGERLFAMVLSAGLDAEVVRRVHDQRTGNITHLAYARPLLQAIGGYQYPKVTATSWTRLECSSRAPEAGPLS